MADEKRIRRKYDVKRTDGSSDPGGEHEHCAYFVLDLEHDEFAIHALRAYARVAKATKPKLVEDIKKLIAAQIEKNDARCNCREASCPHSLRQAFTQTANDAAHDLMNKAGKP